MTKIEWTEESWNPVTGCTKKSYGCRNCYAERMANRLAGRFGYSKYFPFSVTIHEDKLEKPLHWKKPRRIFVCSMGDLFHENIPFEFIKRVWNIIEQCPQHTFQILTKRPLELIAFTKWMAGDDDISIAHWPRNCWLGVSVENQGAADARIPILLQIPAAVRFVSVEPMLGPVDLKEIKYPDGDIVTCVGKSGHLPPPWNGATLDWVICGGESGPGARPMHPAWARSLRDQCQDTGTSFFFKQWGNWKPLCPYYEENEDIRDLALDHPKAEIVSYSGSIWDVYIDGQPHPDCYLMANIGKKQAGLLLDGREWNQYPRPLALEGMFVY